MAKEEFLDEIYHPKRYATCKICNKVVDETSLQSMLTTSLECPKGNCPYQAIVYKDEGKWD